MAANKKAIIIDLYRDGFDPVLCNCKAEQPAYNSIIDLYQNLVTQSQRLIFIFPLWWGSYPAIIKGFFDRVLISSFAFKKIGNSFEGLLKYLTVDFIFTMDQSASDYQQHGLLNSFQKINKHIICNFCGCQLDQFIIIDNIRDSTHLQIKEKITFALAKY